MRNINSIEHSEKYDSYYSFVDESESLEQSGIKGMRWGVRRWQNADGSLTAAGRIHYGVGTRSNNKVIDAVARDRATEYKQTKNAIIGTVLGGPGLGTAIGVLLTRSKGKGYEKLVQEYKDSPEFKNLEKTLNEETAKRVYSDLMAQQDADLKEIDKMAKSGSSSEKKYDDIPSGFGDEVDKVFNKLRKELDPNNEGTNLSDGYWTSSYKDKEWEYQGEKDKDLGRLAYKIYEKERKNKKEEAVREQKMSRVVALYDLGYSAKEVAKKLRIPEGTVNSWLNEMGL